MRQPPESTNNLDIADRPHRFRRGIFGFASQAYLCVDCGDTEANHTAAVRPPYQPPDIGPDVPGGGAI